MRKYICCLLAVAAILLQSYSISFCETLKMKYNVTKKLISFVDDAAALIEKDGEKVFEEFIKPGSIWSHGETYIIIFDMDGRCLVHTDFEQVGKNHLNLKDVNGKPIFRSIAKKVSGSNKSGWTHYLWPKPQSVFPSWKSVYATRVKAPSDKEYIVTCGLYNMKMEKKFIVEIVNKAVSFIKKRREICDSGIHSRGQNKRIRMGRLHVGKAGRDKAC